MDLPELENWGERRDPPVEEQELVLSDQEHGRKPK